MELLSWEHTLSPESSERRTTPVMLVIIPQQTEVWKILVKMKTILTSIGVTAKASSPLHKGAPLAWSGGDCIAANG